MSDASPPGHPGDTPRWISSRKSGVGTALSSECPVWFTLGEGIINEVFYPRIDCANTREIGFLVTDDHGFVADERCDTEHALATKAPGVPAYLVTNTCKRRRFRITKTIFADVRRPALVIRVHFERLSDAPHPLRLFVFVDPHVANQGAHNDAWVGSFRDTPLLLARRAHVTLAVACSIDWRARSCGYIGRSDGRDDLRRHGRLTHEYPAARDGNVGMIGEVGLPEDGEVTIVVGFGDQEAAAGHIARATLRSSVDETEREYVHGWLAYHATCDALGGPCRNGWDIYRMSLAVLRVHESKRFHGGIIASLAIPWGGYHGDQDMGGYHLAWPRDLAHAATAALAAGRLPDARQAMFYLICTQNPEGNWTQNMWVDGTPNWTARQLDQTASFVLLVARLHLHGGVGPVDPWPAVRGACEYIVRHGPVTGEDRWEEDEGFTPYTLATSIAALVEGAGIAEAHGDRAAAERWLGTADRWNDSIERWLYVTDTPLAREVGVEGYYVRLAPPETTDASQLRHLIVPLKNYDPPARGHFEAWRITSPDVLALVRYGLRRPDDPRIRNTVRVIDATLKDETRSGPAWRRFNHDGYGEADDGRPFLGTGVGRCWPVLTGERAHYELACGNRAGAEALLDSMAAQAWHGLLPEQIWNADDIPARGLFNGEPTGSATPLVWAHAEYVALLRSLRDGAIFDQSRAAAARYLTPRGSPAGV